MKNWFLCPSCQAIYYREETDNKECTNCGPTTLKTIEGRLILRCKKCGLTQNQTSYKEMQSRDLIKCQNSNCNGKVKAIPIGGAKLDTNDAKTPQTKTPPSRRTLEGTAKNTGTVQGTRNELIQNLSQSIQKQSVPAVPSPSPTFQTPKAKDHSGIKLGDYLPFNDDFVVITEKIGTGGMGAVFKGYLHKSQQEVAIKEFYYTRYHDPETAENRCESYWIREQTLIEIQSKSPEKCMHLIGSIKLNQFQNPEYYIIIEFIKGIPLEKWYTANFSNLSTLTYPILRSFIVDLLMPIARHMHFVHEAGIVHRDLTVQNIMIVPTDKGFYPIIIDWGVAKQISPEKIYNPRKPYYISSAPEATGIRNRGTPPEVMAGFDPIAASDIYMLGHVMFFLFSGGRYCRTAATHEDYVLHPGDYNPNLPPDFNKLVEYMTQYEPADRMPNMVKVYEALQWLNSTTQQLEHPEAEKAKIYLFCDYNNSYIPIMPNKLLQIGRDEVIKAGTNHDYDGHLYNALVPIENGQFQFEFFLENDYLFVRDVHSKLGSFISNLTMPNQQTFNNVPIKGQSNVYIPISEQNLNHTLIEIPFVAPDGVTYRIPFKIVNKT
jgi:serine/threonine protein kinase/ribosomal protein S27AE